MDGEEESECKAKSEATTKSDILFSFSQGNFIFTRESKSQELFKVLGATSRDEETTLQFMYLLQCISLSDVSYRCYFAA